MAVDTPAFTGFRPEAIQFLADLAENNDARLVHRRARPTTSGC